MTVLVLAGTSEARALVGELVSRGIDVVASLAGRTAQATPLPSPTRIGGFGGVDGLIRELRERNITALIDATHPFADTMPLHAREAAAAVGIPHVRLLRPAWEREPDDDWTDVEDARAAATALRPGDRALLALGRQELDTFRHLDGVVLVIRAVDEPPPGPWAHVLLGRGPFGYDDERAVLVEHQIDVLVTRNSGGPRAKLDAAREVAARVVMICRPPVPDMATVTGVDDALVWLRAT